MRPLIWFRSDLRTHDNLALSNACAAALSSRESVSAGAVALFVISPGQWKQHDYAACKVDMIVRTLKKLSASLLALNIPLRIGHAETFRNVPEVVLRVAQDCGCDGLFFNREYELDEAGRDSRTIDLCAKLGIKTFAYDDQVFAPPGSVRTGSGTYFTVFTPFKKASFAKMLRDGIPSCVPVPKPLITRASFAQGGPIKADPVPDLVAGFESSVAPSRWPAGETHAREALALFTRERIIAYKDGRDFPAKPATSAMSPYLTVGAISCRQCLNAAIEANPVKNSQTSLGTGSLDAGAPGVIHWISELLWREFYIHITIGFPRVCTGKAFQKSTEAIRWNDNAGHFDAWCRGQTGVPIVDAGMRQLLRDGWMHNRVRMIVAMYLTKNLFLNWRLGEAHFMRHLVDGFLASNNGGWQWSASTGTDAAPYFRVFNPVSQSTKFDPDGAYIREFVPELRDLEGDAIHQPWEIPSLLRQMVDYPAPLVDLSSSRARAIKAFQVLKGRDVKGEPDIEMPNNA